VTKRLKTNLTNKGKIIHQAGKLTLAGATIFNDSEAIYDLQRV
jgi:hypothetical protein